MAEKREMYIVYISYFLEKIAVLTPESELKAFLRKHLGSTTVKGASVTRLKSTSHLLYLSQLARHVTCYSAWDLVFKHKITTGKLKDFIDEALVLREKYGIPEPSVRMGTSPKEIDAAIKYIVGQRKTAKYIQEIMESPRPETSPRASPSPRAKPTKRRAPKSRKSPRKSGACKDYYIKDLRKMAADKKIKGRGSMNKAQLCEALGIGKKSTKPVKRCKDYYITDLRKMATAKKIKGRSGMTKKELCKALKIKD